MWFWLSIIALLFWSGSDLFSKIGCRDGSDKLSHLKMVIAVGVVMGLHACWEIFIGGVEISWQIIWTYLPVSILYILSMTLGYLGLRYIELSISSPICNASGALVAVAGAWAGGVRHGAARGDMPPSPSACGAALELPAGRTEMPFNWNLKMLASGSGACRRGRARRQWLHLP